MAECARRGGLLLALDYDGTLAEISADPSRALPCPGARDELTRLLEVSAHLRIAIITGRRLEEVRRLLQIKRGVAFSGLHGLERLESDGRVTAPPQLASYVPELDKLRNWLRAKVPQNRGFWIEDKQFTLGLHYRLAEPTEAAALCAAFEAYAAAETPRLKLMHLKMLIEATPPLANKGSILREYKASLPASYITAYFGDDTTDEDAFAVLDPNDFGVLVGPPRPTHARFRINGPSATVAVLRTLAGALAN